MYVTGDGSTLRGNLAVRTRFSASVDGRIGHTILCAFEARDAGTLYMEGNIASGSVAFIVES